MHRNGAMTAEAPRRRAGARPRRSIGRLPQLPWAALRNPYPPMQVLSADQVEAIHRTSLRILEELGIELMSARARELFRAAGAKVDAASARTGRVPRHAAQSGAANYAGGK